MQYDSGGDRQQQPIVGTLLTDPRPFVYEFTAHEDKAAYQAADHAEKLERQFNELRAIKPGFKALSLHTDNENTMIALGRELKERCGVERVGGAPHGLNKVIGTYIVTRISMFLNVFSKNY